MAQRKFRKRRFTTQKLSIAKKALRKVNKLARRIKPEMKIHDIALTTISPTAAGLVNDLSAIAQGITVITRVGLEIRPFFFEFRYSVFKHATPTTTLVRIIIVRDNRQVESTAPSVLDVINAAVPESPYTRVNPKRFTILYNKIILLRTNRIGTTHTVTKKISFPIVYVGAATTTITKNGIFLITESSATGGQEPSFRFTWRLRFSDS